MSIPVRLRQFANENAWVQLDLDGRFGLRDIGIHQNEITEVDGVTVEDGLIKLDNGSFRIGELFRVAPPVPHAAGQTNHFWAIILRTNYLVDFTIAADNSEKGLFWRQTPTQAALKVGGWDSGGEADLKWSNTMVLQHYGPDAEYSVLRTDSKELRFPSQNCVAFGGITISGTANIVSLKVVKARLKFDESEHFEELSN